MTEGKETISVQGARVHNLKNIDVEIPRDSLTVIYNLRRGTAQVYRDILRIRQKFPWWNGTS